MGVGANISKSLKMPEKIVPLLDTFFGVRIRQSILALSVFEQILCSEKIGNIVELGTGNGALSLYFLCWALNKEARFTTFDKIKLWENNKLFRLLNLQQHFIQLNIFKEQSVVIQAIRSDQKTLLFCDNGRKSLEVELFSSFLKPKDILGVHDWKTEVHPRDIPANFSSIFRHLTEQEQWLRFWTKNK